MGGSVSQYYTITLDSSLMLSNQVQVPSYDSVLGQLFSDVTVPLGTPLGSS